MSDIDEAFAPAVAAPPSDRRTYAAQPGFPCPCHLTCSHRTPLPLTPCLLCLTGRCDHDR